jgi:hypothetical protein
MQTGRQAEQRVPGAPPWYFSFVRRRFVPLAAIFALAILALAGVRAAQALEPAPSDWHALASVREIQVLSENPDGSARETTVWLAVVDGEGFIRTGNTSWYPNLERKPEIGVRVDGKEYAVRAEPIEDESLRERVIAGFREKYGFSDRMVAWFFPGRPHIVKLAPRAP